MTRLYEDKTDELIRQAEEAMPYCEETGDWKEFSRIRSQLEKMPYTYLFVMAGPEFDKSAGNDLKIDIRSVKGNRFRQICDEMKKRYGTILHEREIFAASCLLENIHQHVKKGIGLCVIKIVLGKYRRITVTDNGTGFYNYKKQKKLSVKDAIKFGRAYGSRYKSLGQALAISFGLWSDLATVETNHESAVIVPEGTFKRIIKGLFRFIFALTVALGADALILALRSSDISWIDIPVILSVFGIVIGWNKILSFFGKYQEEKYFPGIRFSTENKQRFGSAINIYFCDSGEIKKWREEMIRELEDYLQKRADTFRADE